MTEEPLKLQVEVLPHGEGLGLPEHATAGSSGVDLRAAVERPVRLEPGGRAMVPTGLRVAIPAGWEWQIRPRSGLAAREGVTVLNAPGTVDSDYRGEVKVILVNLGDQAVEIARGDRVAQAVLAAVRRAELKRAEGLPESRRGTGGFGHTGRS
jgi:dUTP pyrophosphatase